jgi:hypothetical protein
MCYLHGAHEPDAVRRAGCDTLWALLPPGVPAAVDGGTIGWHGLPNLQVGAPATVIML